MTRRSRTLLLAALVAVAAIGCSNPATTAARQITKAATPTPAPKPPTTDDVLARLTAAHLPVDATTVFTAETDSNHLLGRPGQYIAKVSWHDSRVAAPVDPKSLGVSDGGGVEIFASSADRAPREEYLRRVSKAASIFVEYTDEVGAFTLLRQSHDLTPDQAAEYRKALAGLA